MMKLYYLTGACSLVGALLALQVSYALGMKGNDES